MSVLDTEEQLPGQMNMEEYIPMPEPANAFELIEDEEQNAEQEVKKERRVSHESCKRIPGIVSKDRCSAGRMGKNASKIG